MYCDFGLPRKIITYNGPYFKAVDFKEFHGKLGVTTQTSSAYNHQSVGSVEQMVQTVKQIMIKNLQNAWIAMLIFKAMWIPDVHKSLVELLNLRKVHTNLPMIDLNQKVNEPKLDSLVDKCQKCHQYRQRIAKIGCGNKGSI